ncbi:MAG: hypothetical protein RTV72_12185 [Candidatus Thorarchaeota archaeon]
MSICRRVVFGIRWISKTFFVLLLIISIIGLPTSIIASLHPNSDDNSSSVNTESLVSPEFEGTSFLSSIYPETNTNTSYALQSTIEKFVNTSWNIKSEESIRLEENNDTIVWPEPPPQIVRNVVNSSVDLNSSISTNNIDVIGQSLILSSSSSTGTNLFEDDCSSTSGWVSQTSWPGEQLLTQIQTGIQLWVNNGRYKSENIPGLGSVYMHGPMWTKTLTLPAAVGEGLNLEVELEHEFNWDMMGDVGVAIYDMNNEIIFRVWIHDAWDGTRNDVKVGYYFLDSQGGGASIQSVQLNNGWSDNLRVWYDKDSDSVKAIVKGVSYTLVVDPSEEELTRQAKTVAIYFGRLQAFDYESKFIDSIHLSVDTSSTTGYPACPVTPAMEGHWFPQEAYSRLYFEIDQPHSDYYYNLRIRIECDQDTYDRTFTVKVNNILCYSGTIYDELGFDDVVVVPYLIGIQKVELQINWGAYVEKGWKLTYFYPERANGEPLEVTGEYFPQVNPARLTYLARLGPDTKINLKQEADQDPWARTTRVYIDGQLKHSDTGDNAWEWSLGDYAYNSLHEVVIELQYGGFAEWGKKLSINRVHYLSGQVEIDYMSGHAPTQNDIDVWEAYYINMGYHRSEFYIDDLVTYVYEFDLTDNGYLSQQYWDYSNTYRDHAGDWKWEWMLCVHYLSYNDVRTESLGYHIGPHYGIVIHDQLLLNAAFWPWTPPISAYRRSVGFHEYGHHINIIDRLITGEERYCLNLYCMMARALLNIVNYPWYCEHHWSLHRWPGW